MSDHVSLLTWNVQMRSWGMELGADESFPPSTTAEERAVVIAKKVANSPRDFDVVCFNEVFDEDSRDILERELCGSGRFPYAVIKCDLGLLRVRTGHDAATLTPDMWLDLVGLGGGIGLAQLFARKFEDSGLMVFSRLPFVRHSLPASYVPLLGTRIPVAWGAQGVPDVSFFCYGAASDNDKSASKGVVHAGLQLGGDTLHVFASHTQADSKRSGENVGDREKQMHTVATVVEALAGNPPANNDLVIFCGDLNIVGGQRKHRQPFDGEWHDRFDVPGSGVLTDHLIDVWGRDQCKGAAPGTPVKRAGLRDPGITAPVVYTPTQQRLDYVFVNLAGERVVQHLRVDHDLSLVPVSGLGYLSDHKPLSADIHRRQAFNTPATAEVLVASPDESRTDWLSERSVHWYRINEDGTYEIDLSSASGRASYEVYLDTDLSTPWPQFRHEVGVETGERFVLPSAPFLVKVLMRDTRGELNYTLRVHRHLGDSRGEAIELAPGAVREDPFPDGAILGQDDFETPWDDRDTRWYRISAPTVTLARPMQMSITVRLFSAPAAGIVRLLRDEPGLPVLFDETTTSDASFDWEASAGEHFYLCVQRENAGGPRMRTKVSLTCDFSVLRVRPGVGPRLVCLEETGGWGSDDISWTLRADGAQVAHASNKQFGDMDDEDVRDLQPWLKPGPVYYVQKLELEVREEDDIDPDDVGFFRIKPFNGLAALPGVTVGPDGIARGSVFAAVDDGRYELQCEVARWDPEA